eukprot:TRINITY_DN60018_c0_g1_i1.p1 TRINITY_DN60018_c0_g1~~TRINITY_DN60018_c0_g1_i1.p1  ORF type:complete len:367 (+),score=85.38 TRINITY_DN60018_c0_g1_i1:81-1103(+)
MAAAAAQGAASSAARGCIGLSLFDVSVPQSPTRLEQIAVFYSLVPWIGAFVWILAAAVLRRASLVVPLIWVGLAVLLSEGFIKKLWPQPRPEGSCLYTPGMPSSHSMIAAGMITHEFLLRACRARDGLRYALLRRLKPGDVPGTALWREQYDPLRRYLAPIAVLCVFLPVPFSRYIVQDHSQVQILVGSLTGIICACIGQAIAAILFGGCGSKSMYCRDAAGNALDPLCYCCHNDLGSDAESAAEQPAQQADPQPQSAGSAPTGSPSSPCSQNEGANERTNLIARQQDGARRRGAAPGKPASPRAARRTREQDPSLKLGPPRGGAELPAQGAGGTAAPRP